MSGLAVDMLRLSSEVTWPLSGPLLTQEHGRQNELAKLSQPMSFHDLTAMWIALSPWGENPKNRKIRNSKFEIRNKSKIQISNSQNRYA
jgi:hypothetical protein